ncbi:Threonine/homoserine/homoserine lactone efflux protein [Ruegeria halocynthiae]|uniref:Threonine/homoserine/homoserine lactone efflux protein n=1 Tax=Ruegeria halocynthiae TaxID=985054 RepID=A0A1H3CWD7_9RHOB|nr:LysE family translocator [Ruegeria halocynthiae]SDX58437.1 Threonine/homoserine/homoserine lactone efflux protein [Ruegeria halocynthiae]
MIDLTSLAVTALAFFVVAVSPGPANISNAAVAMTYGRKTSLRYGVGLSCGLVFWGLVAASGMGAVLQSSLYVLMVLKVLGGLYLLWLAWQSGRSALQSDAARVSVPAKGKWFWRGLILNLSNPKSVIAWMAALSVGLGPDDGLLSVAVATLICIVAGFLNNFLYSMLFSISGMMAAYRRFRRRIDGVVAGLFAVAGFGLIRSAFTR